MLEDSQAAYTRQEFPRPPAGLSTPCMLDQWVSTAISFNYGKGFTDGLPACVRNKVESANKGPMAVSYTHLDVYKRQVEITVFKLESL